MTPRSRRSAPGADLREAGGRGRLTRDRVLDAALAIADREGLPALTMRRLAAELGVAPMAVYMHVRSKEELLDGVADRIADQLEVPAEPGGDWAAQLREVARSMRKALAAHRLALALFMTTQPLGPGGNMRVAAQSCSKIDAACEFHASNALHIVATARGEHAQHFGT